MQQRRQAALHAHLVRQRLAAEAAADQHQQQLAAAEQVQTHALHPGHLEVRPRSVSANFADEIRELA